MKKLIRSIAGVILMGVAGMASAYTHIYNYDLDPDLAAFGSTAGGYSYAHGTSFDDVYTFTTLVPNVDIGLTLTWNPNTTTNVVTNFYYGTPGTGFLIASISPVAGQLYTGTLPIAGSWYFEDTGLIIGKKGGGYAGTFDMTVPSAVPEPGEWAMMLSGFGLIGVFARRRSKNATLHAAAFPA